MTNFDFLKSDPRFAVFADAAAVAEQVLHISVESCVFNCRRAMEFAVKWMYSVDNDLVLPYDDSLHMLMNSSAFVEIVGNELWRKMDFIRKVGNFAAHGSRKVKNEEAELCLRNLFEFMDFVACCYGENYQATNFDPTLAAKQTETVIDNSVAINFEELLAENEKLKAELTARREEQKSKYQPPKSPSEYETRKLYIDVMLRDAGWIEGKDWINEFPLAGMPNKSEIGFADYVLNGDDGRPLAVLEAKKTCVEISVGRHQAKLYADLLEKQYGRRPVIFLSNGFDTVIWNDKYYNERKVASIYSKRDLEKLFNLQSMRISLKNAAPDKKIAGRYYQENAIKAVCKSFDEENRRKALLVMATGSGKTRTVIALCKILLEHGWVKNILFLADRTSLVTQAKRSFTNLLPDLSVSNLCEDKQNYNAHCIFSTYQTMMNCIDSAKDENGKRLFTCGHFDLVICDEAHRSIYNKYKEIFSYFDAHLVGLTATPKNEIDKNTYDIFELSSGIPTYGYELAQAVKDGFLVDYISIETKLKFLTEGIVYDDLSDEEKQDYEDRFATEDGELPESISSNALNEWIFNKDTVREVLHLLMTDGLKIDYGTKIGKTVIFAKNHKHAEWILNIFNSEYPHLVGYAKVIDNHVNYAQKLIDEFSDPKKLPQIAISVDMLDTGIDVPEILNLVFFKKVMSKAKFWQMIGRGTRKCPELIDGKDKEIFYIFDFCGNFEFFRLNKSRETPNRLPLQGAIFNLKAQIVSKLQDIEYHTDELVEFRNSLIQDMIAKVSELNKENFAVMQHLRYVEKYSKRENYNIITENDILIIADEIASLVYPDKDDAKAVRFDALIYGVELAYLMGKKFSRARNEIMRKTEALASIAIDIPQIMEKEELIKNILHTDYLDNAGINEFEYIRKELRDLIIYIPVGGDEEYIIDFVDQIVSIDKNKSNLDGDDFVSYRAKAEYYIRKHPNEKAIAKLKSNIPLTMEDISDLERILWSEVGTQSDYEAEIGKKPLGEFVREIVGLDMNAAKEAFADYLSTVNLDSRQIYFVNQIIEFIVQNGLMKDFSILQEAPFADQGSIVDIFDDMNVWLGIKKIIDNINTNATA